MSNGVRTSEPVASLAAQILAYNKGREALKEELYQLLLTFAGSALSNRRE